MTIVLASFLAVHGLLHLAIWVPKPKPADTPPFHPDHSAALTAAHTPAEVTRALALVLAAGAAATYLLAAVAVTLDAGWTVPVALSAAALGLLRKGLYFNPWLLLGIALDGLVLTAAIAEWPIPLT